MLDYRIKTFLKLCESMNYRITANQLHMTQPAVTQHIQYLEKEYHCKLFHYDGRKLLKTHAADILEEYARAGVRYENELEEVIGLSPREEMRIGATKTIGEYIIKDRMQQIILEGKENITYVIENTSHLLEMIDHNELDLAVVEGFFDKEQYGFSTFKKEKFVGVCAPGHPFSGKSISLEQTFLETILLREKGSGTRAVLEQLLLEQNYTVNQYSRQICMSEFSMIRDLVQNGTGISFVYESVAKKEQLPIFKIDRNSIEREFNYVFLKHTEAEKYRKRIEAE